ncbi:MAG: hypothetical protein Q9227_003421 [Pyrenula ochraceoflavens]
MSSLTSEQARELQDQLRDAIVHCSERCLYQSAKWAAELLDSIDLPESFNSSDGYEVDSQMQDIDQSATVNPILNAHNEDPVEAALEAREAHKYLLAKSYFDTREYDRCAAVFLPLPTSSKGLAAFEKKSRGPAPTTPLKPSGRAETTPKKPVTNPFPKLSQKSLFLSLYARYLSGEKKRDEETEMVLGPAEQGVTVNRELAGLARGLEGYFIQRREENLEDKNQGWLEYLYGVILTRSKNEEEAKYWLLQAVHRAPFHWGAWRELNDLLADSKEAQQVYQQLPQNIMTLIFHLYSSQELFQTTDDIHSTLDSLLAIFPRSYFLQTQRAMLLYHAKELEDACRVFKGILIDDPYRLDGLDHYSNILYVLPDRPQLSFLAQVATATDKFRPETCVVVGNYYSLKSEHEKAVMYFRRALTLDRSFLSAWTLMGHEYVEMKNTHAAIESYRRAVDVNRKDYRAWYGLGQAYEVLDMSFYALFYYQKAAALRPYDPKMWQAVGSCYAKIGKTDQGIRALKRALAAGTYYETIGTGSSFGSSVGSRAGKKQQVPTGRKILDPDTLYHIASMYERIGDYEQAAAYMELTIQQETGSTAKALEQSLDDDATDVMSNEDNDDSQFGTGVTATTSKARLWLARWASQNQDYDRADMLAGELCQDGVEVEEAKALMRDIRARKERQAG